MARKLGIALACILLTAVLYAAANGGFNSSTQVTVAADGSSMLPPDMQTALNAAIAPDQSIISLSSELPPHDPTVGKLAGSAGTSGGAASYSIPITLPPGRRGMQPSLSLDYSSRAGTIRGDRHMGLFRSLALDAALATLSCISLFQTHANSPLEPTT